MYKGVAAAALAAAAFSVSPVAHRGPAILVAPSYQANQAASRREASNLLALAQVPPAAVRQARGAGPTEALQSIGRPLVASLIERSATWTVAEPSATLAAWLKVHRPPGLSLSGSSSGSGSRGWTYSAPATTAWGLAELAEAVAPLAPGRSVLSVAAMVAPLDPRPLPDNAGGPRLRVTVAGGCPRSDAHAVGVLNPGADLSHALVPPGAPGAGLVCLYGGAGALPSGPSSGALAPSALAHHALLGKTAAGALAAEVRAIPLSHMDGAQMSCPADDGDQAIVALAYPSSPDVDLWVALSGCGGVANGYIRAGTGGPSQAQLSQALERYAR